MSVSSDRASLLVNNEFEVRLSLPYIPDGKLAENKRRGMHWAAYADLLESERELAVGYLKQALAGSAPRRFQRCSITTWFNFKRKAPVPDYENLVAREKPLVDALVQVGFLLDDGWKVVVARETEVPRMGVKEDSVTIMIIAV